jgi:hypothetical protein
VKDYTAQHCCARSSGEGHLVPVQVEVCDIRKRIDLAKVADP